MRKSAIPRRLKSSRFLLPTDTALRTNGFEFDSLDVDPVKFAISFDFYAGSLADAFLLLKGDLVILGRVFVLLAW